MAFYAIFSLTPLVLTVVAVAGWFVGDEFARSHFLDQVTGLLGDRAADAVGSMMDAARTSSGRGPWAGIVSLVVLLAGSSGVFVELRNALDAIHGTRRNEEGFVSWFVRGRLWSFALVLAVGFLLLLSLMASAMIAAIADSLLSRFPTWGFIAVAFNLLLSFTLLTALFALLMRFLPTERKHWKSVWRGALLASILLQIGKELLGLYLGRAAFADAYGAAGSLIVLVTWIYFGVQVFLFGAAWNEARTKRRAGRAPAGDSPAPAG